MLVKSPTTEYYFNRYQCLEVSEMLTLKQCEELVEKIVEYPSQSQDRQQLDSPHWYAAPPSEKILDFLVEPISRLIGVDLFPAYSYVRKYLPGDVLKRHIDLSPCEFSASILLAKNHNCYWPLLIPAYEDNYSVREFLQEPGDAAIFSGSGVPHWRNKFVPKSKDHWQFQGLFHFVGIHGPNAHFKYNGRDKLNY